MRKRASALSFVVSPLALLAAGCFWPGHTLSLGEIEYAHPSVQWVYRTGGQTGFTMIFFMPLENVVQGLQVSKDGVLVRESPFSSNLCWAGVWEPVYALDSKTGALTLGRVPKEGWRGQPPASSQQASDSWSSMQVDEDTEFCLREQDPFRTVSVGRPGESRDCFTRLVTLRSDMPGFGRMRNWARPTQASLVFSCGDCYVICVDLSQVPGHPLASMPGGS
jgi:hypothetical protein